MISKHNARHYSFRILMRTILCLCALISVCSGHSSRRLPLAGIFGIGGNDKTEDQQSKNQQGRQQLPPPPPLGNKNQGPVSSRDDGRRLTPQYEAGRGDIPGPPRLVRQNAGSAVPPPPPPPNSARKHSESESDAVAKGGSESVDEQNLNAKSQMTLEREPMEMVQPPPNEWMNPPPMDQYGWGPPPGYYDPYDNGNQMYMDQSVELLAQLDNLTASVMIMEQREELHIRQLDVLTERIMDIEAQAADDRNLLVEYESNCTSLGLTIEKLKDEVGGWQKRCSELSKSQESDQERITELKNLLKEKQNEAEEIAIAIENIRLAEKRREANASRRVAKKKSLLARFFGLFFGEKEDFEEMSREDAYDVAKSTLLRALQSERANVHELEGIVTSLQQNNSAISEMVESRDTVIDELNNRISVFEEDKVVLKAALRQLQKEIKEEAPKAQKLMDDLAAAKEEVERLKEEMSAMIQTHQEELSMLQQTISLKQKTLTESESNLTAIGTYVDKLEDRLTSFAVTRRDMEEREKRCKEIEESAVAIGTQKKDLEAKVEAYVKEQEELKKLLEELVAERASLQKDNRKLATDMEFRMSKQDQLQSKCSSLECEVKELSEALHELRSNSDVLRPALQAAEQTNLELQDRLDRALEQERELGKVKSENNNLNEELRLLKESNAQLEAQLSNTTELLQTLKSQPTKEVKNATKQEAISRSVPFRSVRKQLSKATGIHGALTPSSAMLKEKSLDPDSKPRGRPVGPTGRNPPLPDHRSERTSRDDTERQPRNPPPLPP